MGQSTKVAEKGSLRGFHRDNKKQDSEIVNSAKQRPYLLGSVKMHNEPVSLHCHQIKDNV